MTGSVTHGRRIVCRFFSLDEFNEFLSHLYEGEPTGVDVDYQGIYIGVGEDDCCPSDLHERIAKELGVAEVTSIHIDDCDEAIGVWVAVKEA